MCEGVGQGCWCDFEGGFLRVSPFGLCTVVEADSEAIYLSAGVLATAGLVAGGRVSGWGDCCWAFGVFHRTHNTTQQCVERRLCTDKDASKQVGDGYTMYMCVAGWCVVCGVLVD